MGHSHRDSTLDYVCFGGSDISYQAYSDLPTPHGPPPTLKPETPGLKELPSRTHGVTLPSWEIGRSGWFERSFVSGYVKWANTWLVHSRSLVNSTQFETLYEQILACLHMQEIQAVMLILEHQSRL